MNELTAQWLIPITTNLIAAILIWLIGSWMARFKDSINRVKGVAMMTTKRMLPTMLNAAVYVLWLWYLLARLGEALGKDGPVLRIEVALIAWLSCAICLTFVAIVMGFKLFDRKTPDA